MSFQPGAFPAPTSPPSLPVQLLAKQQTGVKSFFQLEPNPSRSGILPRFCLPLPHRRAGALGPGPGAGRRRQREERGVRPVCPSVCLSVCLSVGRSASPAMRVPLPALLCCSAASLLLLLLRWRWRRGLWKKVKEARQRQERSLVQMEMAVRRFREQVGAINRASPLLHPPGLERLWMDKPPPSAQAMAPHPGPFSLPYSPGDSGRAAPPCGLWGGSPCKGQLLGCARRAYPLARRHSGS